MARSQYLDLIHRNKATATRPSLVVVARLEEPLDAARRVLGTLAHVALEAVHITRPTYTYHSVPMFEMV